MSNLHSIIGREPCQKAEGNFWHHSGVRSQLNSQGGMNLCQGRFIANFPADITRATAILLF
jgi:hypothetical protein